MKNYYLTFFKLAWPLILSNITIPLLGMVDIAVVGHQNDTNLLASIAIGGIIFDTLFLLFGFLRMSTTGLVAQAPNNNYILYRALIFALLIGTLLISFQSSIYQIVIYLFNVNDSTESIIRSYFYHRIYSALPTLLNFVLFGYFFAKQNTKAPLLLLLIMNGSAIVLDFILVTYGHYAERGIAIANIISQTLGSLIGLRLLFKDLKPIYVNLKQIFKVSAFVRLISINKDIFIRTLCLLSTFAFFTYQGASYGTHIVAANAILLTLHHFVAYALDAFAIVCESLVGQAIFEKNKEKFDIIQNKLKKIF